MSDSLPPLFIQKLTNLYPHLTDDDINHIFAPKSLRCFRINILKTKKSTILETLKKENLEVINVDFLDAFFVKKNDEKKLSPLIEKGDIIAQSLSSQLPAILLQPRPTDLILDLCAAPGSKTSQIVSLTHSPKNIIANDIDSVRTYKMKSIFANLSIDHVTIAKSDGRSIWKQFPNHFDKVLVDVPCSMEGRFVGGDEKTFSHWSPKKVKNLSKLQKFLLYSAFSACKPGGRIVYSTCTLSTEENEEVVTWLLEKLTGKIELIDIDSIKSATNDFLSKYQSAQISTSIVNDGITNSYRNTKINSELKNCLRILPSPLTEGFFVAVFEKRA